MARQEWGKEVEFILACIGNAVGLGNLWRFPYLCYASGGGAFLIPYFLMLVVCGIPLLYLELAIGQFTKQGPVGALRKLSPFFQGAGMGTIVLSFLFTTYYNVVLAWALYFMVTSFFSPLPWSTCDNHWNTHMCWGNATANGSVPRPNDSLSPTQEYFENRILEESGGIDEQGGLVWQLVLLLLAAWFIVYLCLWKGIRWTGKVVYFTATFPYVLILVLLIQGLMLPGSHLGVDFFIRPKWELLKDPKVWVYAAAQNFNSIGIGFGSMIAFASYSKQESRIFRSAMIVALVNSATSILAGFTVFSVLGHIAYNQGQDIDKVVTDGPGLVFIVYPAAFASLGYPGGQILAALFFFMLVCLAVDSQFASVEVVLTTLEDHGARLGKVVRRREVLTLLVCGVAFLLSLPNVTRGGIYFFKIIDSYSSGISNMLISFFECIAVSWAYGGRRLARNLQAMTGRYPLMYFVVCWYSFSPLLILTIMIFNWVSYTPVTYGDYVFPQWAEGLGWALAGLSLVCLPIGMVKGVVQAEGRTCWQKFVNSFKPEIADVSPANGNHGYVRGVAIDDDKVPQSTDIAATSGDPPAYHTLVKATPLCSPTSHIAEPTLDVTKV